MGDEDSLAPQDLIHLQQAFAVAVHVEVRHPPHALAQDPHHGADVVELHPQPCGAQLDHLQSGRLRSGDLDVRVSAPSLLRGGGAEEMLDQLEGGGRADVLGEVLTARREHARDLRPVGGDRVAGGDQVGGAVGERYRSARGRLMDLHPARTQQLPGSLGVRRPRLRDVLSCREHRTLGEHLAASGVEIHRDLRLRHRAGEQVRVAPRRALLGGPALEGVEAPAGDIRRGGLGDQMLSGLHGDHGAGLRTSGTSG